MKHHRPSVLKNQKGYLAVFVVLTFQVLFIFFAMVVNIGILIHDKINLQNSVDLAAYYAAGKQAELLNAIAHSNYQIRQAYKLLAWRVRVLGDMGNINHPLLENLGVNPTFQDQAFNQVYPVVCIQHTFWDFNRAIPGQPGDTPDQNFCRNTFAVEDGTGLPRFPEPPPLIADFLGFNTIIRQQIQRLRDLFASACTNYGSINFIMATNWMRGLSGRRSKPCPDY